MKRAVSEPSEPTATAVNPCSLRVTVPRCRLDFGGRHDEYALTLNHQSQVALLALCAQVATAVTPLIVKGTDFVNSVSGQRFQVIGAAYQPGGESGYKPESGQDPLSNAETCLRDAALLQRIGVNTIRIYNLSPDINHDECASIFNIAGIYMMIDVNSPKPNEALSRAAPWESYNHDYLERTFKIVEAFKNYPNTLLFFSANEVINDVPTAITVPYIRVSSPYPPDSTSPTLTSS